MMTVSISQALRGRIFDQLQKTYPNEGGGFLLGEAKADQIMIRDVRPVENVFESEEQYHRYAMTPKDWMKLEDEADAKGLALVGYYHSHPDHHHGDFHQHDHSHETRHEHGRSLSVIRTIIAKANIPEAARPFVQRFIDLTRNEPWVFGIPVDGERAFLEEFGLDLFGRELGRCERSAAHKSRNSKACENGTHLKSPARFLEPR